MAEQQLLLTLPANLPSGYHRDLQLTKEAVMRAVLLGGDLLTAMTQVLPGLRFRPDRMKEATTRDLFATAHALDQVNADVPFREAYREAARQVETLRVPPAEEALATYQVDGFPGRGRPDLIRATLADHQAWLDLVSRS